jgi:hypothetical protein
MVDRTSSRPHCLAGRLAGSRLFQRMEWKSEGAPVCRTSTALSLDDDDEG